MTKHPYYGCGCCGRQIGETDLWCAECSKHVLCSGHLWDRTYFGQHKRNCPWTPQRTQKRRKTFNVPKESS